jgi:hypothetical protein
MSSSKAKQMDLFLNGLHDSSGQPLKNYKAYFWVSSAASTAKTVWSDINKTSVIDQSSGVTLGNKGEIDVYGDGEYYVQIKTPAGVLYDSFTISYSSSVDFGGLYIDIGADYGTTNTAIQSAIDDVNPAVNYTFLFKDAEFSVGASLNFPSNVLVKGTMTATINQSSGTITINRTPEIPDFQFFTGTPSVTYGSAVQEVKPIWTGGDSVTDAVDFKGSVNTTELKLNSTAVTSTASELNLVDGSVAGTVVNSKAAIYDADGTLDMTKLEIGGLRQVPLLNTEKGYVYISGAGNFECSQSGTPGQSVQVDDRASSTFFGSDGAVYVSSNASVVTVSLTSSDSSNPRWDLVELDASSGTYSVVDGTAAANPTYPSGTAEKDPIAYVYRKASTAGNTIYDRDILDARVSIKNKNVDGHFKTNFSINQKEDTENSYYDNQQMYQQIPFDTKFDYVQQDKTNLQYIDTILVPADSVNGEIVYSGTWTNYDDTGAMFGRYKYSSTAGSTAVLSFSGVSCNIIYLKNNNTSFISVELSDDNGVTYHSKKTFNVAVTGDTNPENVTELYQGLEYGDYKVKVTILAGASTFYLDGFSYATYLVQTPMTQKALLSQSPTTIDDVPPLTTLFGGTWDNITGSSTALWNGINNNTSHNSATVEYKFYGSSIYVIGYVYSTYDATFSVTIDGATTYVQNSSVSMPSYNGDRPVWVRLDNGSLPEGVHTVKITTTSTGGSENLGISGWAHYSSKYPTTCARSLICGQNSYAVGIDNSDFTLTGSFTKVANGDSFLGRRADTGTAGDNLTITTPTNCKAIYLITYDRTDQGEVKVTLGASHTRYINIDTYNVNQGSNIKLLYDSYIDGINLDSLTLKIEKNAGTGGTNMRIEGVIFEVGDAVESDSIFCMPKWTRYNTSASHKSPVSTSHRLDVYGSKTDGSTGRKPMVHSGFCYHSSGSFVYYQHGLNMLDFTIKFERGGSVPKIYQLVSDSNADVYALGNYGNGNCGQIYLINYAANEWIRLSLFLNRVI